MFYKIAENNDTDYVGGLVKMIKWKAIAYLTVSYIPWIVYWTFSACGNTEGGIYGLCLVLLLICLEIKQKSISIMDATAVGYFIVAIFATKVLDSRLFVTGDGYLGYGMLFVMGACSMLIKKPFMRFYALKDFNKENLSKELENALTMIWAGVFFIDTFVFIFIHIPLAAVLTSNVFVAIGIVCSIIMESRSNKDVTV